MDTWTNHTTLAPVFTEELHRPNILLQTTTTHSQLHTHLLNCSCYLQAGEPFLGEIGWQTVLRDWVHHRPTASQVHAHVVVVSDGNITTNMAEVLPYHLNSLIHCQGNVLHLSIRSPSYLLPHCLTIGKNNIHDTDIYIIMYAITTTARYEGFLEEG